MPSSWANKNWLVLSKVWLAKDMKQPVHSAWIYIPMWFSELFLHFPGNVDDTIGVFKDALI